jgi:hypothetical protein
MRVGSEQGPVSVVGSVYWIRTRQRRTKATLLNTSDVRTHTCATTASTRDICANFFTRVPRQLSVATSAQQSKTTGTVPNPTGRFSSLNNAATSSVMASVFIGVFSVPSEPIETVVVSSARVDACCVCCECIEMNYANINTSTRNKHRTRPTVTIQRTAHIIVFQPAYAVYQVYGSLALMALLLRCIFPESTFCTHFWCTWVSDIDKNDWRCQLCSGVTQT